MSFDGKAFGDQIVSTVTTYLEQNLLPVVQRLEALEAAIKELPKPKDGAPGEKGKDADPEAVADIVIGRIGMDVSRFSDEISELKLLVPTKDEIVAEVVKSIPVPKDGEPGKDADPIIVAETIMPDLKTLLDEAVSDAVAAIPAPKDGEPGAPGKDADPLEVAEMVKVMVQEAVTEAVTAIPAPKDGEPGAPGKDGTDGKDADSEMIIRHVMENLDTDAIAVKAAALIPAPKDGEDGAPGKDADTEAVAAIVVEQSKDMVNALADEIRQVRETVDALPPIPEPVDKDAIVAEVRALIPDPLPGEPGAPGLKGDKGDPGSDGVGLAGAIIDRKGELALTLTNGEVKHLGVIVGKDGDPGQPGKDGIDGIGWDNLDEVMDHDGRTLIRRHMHGDQIKEFRHTLAIPLDRGVYKDDIEYTKGDVVTYGGGMWIAQQDVSGEKPDSGKSWRLAVKRGRDGKDGVLKDTTPPKVKIPV